MRTHPLDRASSGVGVALRSRLSAGGCEGPALTVEEGEKEIKTESQPSIMRGERDREREKEKDKDKQTIIR